MITLCLALPLSTWPRAGRVAPWDFPDGPNPYAGAPTDAPPLPDPPNLVRGNGSRVTTPSGLTVELVGVGRHDGRTEDEPTSDSAAMWSGDGAPYPWRTGFGPSPAGWAGRSLEDRGARYLEFKIKGAYDFNRPADVIGYVPDGARVDTPRREIHGWDAPHSPLDPDYRTCVVVDDRRATHYRIGIARGEWHPAATVPFGGPADDRSLARGTWGVLRRAKRDYPRPFGPYPEAGYVVDLPNDAVPLEAVKVQLIDASGDLALANSPTRVRVLTRPYEWIELSGVHYDPDPQKWERAYWGEEGLSAVRHADATGLYALAHVPTEPGSDLAPRTYAPDGVRWRAFPLPPLTPVEHGDGPGTRTEPWVATMRLDPSRVRPWSPAWVQGVASGRALPLAREGRPTVQYRFPEPHATRVRFVVRYPRGEWARTSTWTLPPLRLRRVPPDEKAAFEAGTSGAVAFVLSVDVGGRVAATTPAGEDAAPLCPLRIPVASRDGRIVARLRSGVRVPILADLGPGRGGWRVEFDLTAFGDAVYHPREGSTYQEPVRLGDVEAFEVETRGFDAPRTLVAKLPPSG